MRLLVSRGSHPSECESCGPTSRPRPCSHLLSEVRKRPHWPSHQSCRRRRRVQRESEPDRVQERRPRRSDAARLELALAAAATLLLSSRVAQEGDPRQLRARSPTALRRGVRASASGPGRPARRRGIRRPDAQESRERRPLPTRQAGAAPALSTRPRPDSAGRRTPLPPAHARRRACGLHTLNSAEPAMQSARRSARKAASRYDAMLRYRCRTLGFREPGR